VIHIESKDNKNYKFLKSLLHSKGLKKESQCLVMGEALTKELQKKNPRAKKIHFDENLNPDYLLSKELFQSLTLIKTNSPILLLPFEQPVDYKESTYSFEVFLPVGDPKNLGALIRTSVAFGVERITLLEEAAHPFLPECIRASSGAVFRAPLFKGPKLKDLDLENLWSLDMNGESLYNWKPKSLNGVKLLIGEEGGGLGQNHLKKSISIPISKDIESLNVNSALSCTLMWLRSLEPLQP
jgi:tRNA G18 (ribose-2'-O)-methylase SpoU